MDYGDCYWGLYRDYNRDPFPHSLLSTRQSICHACCSQAGPMSIHGAIRVFGRRAQAGSSDELGC